MANAVVETARAVTERAMRLILCLPLSFLILLSAAPVPGQKSRDFISDFANCGVKRPLDSPAASASAAVRGVARRSRTGFTLAVHAATKDAAQIRKALVNAGFAASLLSDADLADPAKLTLASFDADSEAMLTFEAAGRARFGERRLIVLKARR